MKRDDFIKKSKYLILISFVVIISIFNIGCAAFDDSDNDFVNQLELLLEESDFIEEQFNYLDEHSNNLLDEYKQLEESCSNLDSEKDIDKIKEIEARQKDIKSELKDIIIEIDDLKNQQIEVKKTMEKYLEE